MSFLDKIREENSNLKDFFLKAKQWNKHSKQNIFIKASEVISSLKDWG